MKRTIILCTIFSCLLVGRVGFGQSGYWEELPGPPGARPSKVTQMANGWLWASFDNNAGREWYVSKDDGNHWDYVQRPQVCADARIKLGMKETIFAICKDSLGEVFSIQESTDAGLSWVQIDTNAVDIAENMQGTRFAVVKNPGGIASQSHFVFIKPVGAPHWFYNSLGDKVKVNEFNQLFSTVDGTGWFSIDGGASWHFSNYVNIEDEYSFITPDSSLILTGATTFYRNIFSNGGQWAGSILLDSLYPSCVNFLDKIVLLDNGNMLTTNSSAINDDSLYLSSDLGRSWHSVNICNYQVLSIKPLMSGNIPVIYNNSLRFVDSSGNLIDFIPNFPLQSFGTITKKSGNRLISLNAGEVWASLNHGANWERIRPNDFNNKHLYEPAFLNDSIFVLASADKVNIHHFQQDSTIEITPADFGAKESNYYYNCTLLGLDSILILMKTSEPRCNGVGSKKSWISYDYGSNWTSFYPDVFLQLVKHPSGKIFCLGPIGSQTHKLMVKNHDFTWKELPLTAIESYLHFDQNGVLYCGNLMSSDLGESWSPSGRNYSFATNINAFGYEFQTVYDSINWTTDIQFKTSSFASWTALPKTFTGTDSDELLFIDNDGFIYALGSDIANLRYRVFKSRNSTLQGAYLQGQTYKDSDSDCATPDPEAPLPNWIVSATKGNDTWSTNTDSLGQYAMFIDTGTYQLTTRVPLDIYWVNCADSINVNLPVFLDTTTQDLPAVATVDCPYLSVDLVVSAFSPCFETLVCLSAHNYGTVQADSAWVDVQFPTQVYIKDTLFTSYDSLGPGLYRIPLGLVDIGADAMICFFVTTICDTLLTGQTLCATAHVYPDSLCTIPIGWSGAQIEVTAECIGDTTVRFITKNTTNVATQNLEYIIIEDDVVLMQGNYQYGPGQQFAQDLTMPQGDHYYRFQSQQEPNHPFSQLVFAWTEGCGSGVVQSQSFVNQYQVDNGIPAEDVECVEVVAAYDPNDKRGFPLGFGSDQLIEPNTELEYIIRFQNTGTAAARFVVIRDTLSAHLDPTSIRVGASSHAYTWSLNGAGNLAFRFDPIHLPDSTTDLAGSQGFVSFRIKQKPNQPLGTKIENTAFIYFDYNGAIVTNMSRHTLGRDFLTITNIPDEPVNSLATTQPNPVIQTAVLELNQLAEGQEYKFRLLNAQGIQVQDRIFNGQRLVFDRSGQPDGIYYFEVRNNLGQTITRGKLILQ